MRCGRCERVFNALMSLADDVDPEDQSGLSAHGTGSMPALEVGEEELESSDVRRLLDPTPVDIDLDVLESAETGTVETIVLEGDTYTQTEEHLNEQKCASACGTLPGSLNLSPNQSSNPRPP